MSDFFITDNAYQQTASPDTPVVSNPVFEARSVWSINAANILQGTIWVIKNGEHLTSDIFTASYEFFDKDGDAVAIAETGITANAEGFFITAPISAALIEDLTHYTVKLNVGTLEKSVFSVNSVTVAE
jgi:hypothetical protein